MTCPNTRGVFQRLEARSSLTRRGPEVQILYRPLKERRSGPVSAGFPSRSEGRPNAAGATNGPERNGTGSLTVSREPCVGVVDRRSRRPPAAVRGTDGRWKSARGSADTRTGPAPPASVKARTLRSCATGGPRAGAGYPELYRHARVARGNWRSFTGILRKRNVRTVGRGGSPVLAFVYRDRAEVERQNAGVTPRVPPGRSDPSAHAGDERWAGSLKPAHNCSHTADEHSRPDERRFGRAR